MSATTNNFFFAKKEWPDKARNVLCNVGLLSFEPGPNTARNRTFSVLPGPGPARARADLYREVAQGSSRITKVKSDIAIVPV
jgi:hypothetical protein